MTGMSDANSMRQTGRDGESVSPVARATGVSRDTARKYLRKDGFSLSSSHPWYRSQQPLVPQISSKWYR